MGEGVAELIYEAQSILTLREASYTLAIAQKATVYTQVSGGVAKPSDPPFLVCPFLVCL